MTSVSYGQSAFNPLDFATENEKKYFELGQQASRMQGGPQNCLPSIQEALDSSLSNSYDAYKGQTETLMQNADVARRNAQSCRNNLVEHWQRYKEAEQENSKMRNQMALKMRAAELEYKTELNKLKRECQQRANEEQVAYSESISNGGVINDHTMAVGFQQRINNFYNTAFNNCYRGDAVTREGIGLMKSSLENKILEIEAEMKTSNEALAYMSEQVQKLQEMAIKDCEENEALASYNAKLTEQVAQRGRTITSIKNFMGAMTAVASCGDPNAAPLNNTQSNPDATSKANW